MSEASVTIVGNVATDVVHRFSKEGKPWLSFRVAQSDRWREPGTETWVEGATSFYTVKCWRALAVNASHSLEKGDPVIVMGKVAIEEWENEGRTGTSVIIDARVIGPDLTRCTAALKRRTRTVAADPDAEADSGTDADPDEVPPEGVDPVTGEVLNLETAGV